MSWIFLAALALLAAFWLFTAMRNMDRRVLMRSLRWIVGGLSGLFAVIAALLFRRIDLAMLLGAVAASVLLRGRLGQFSFDSVTGANRNTSKVSSRYLAMELDHDTGALTGRVLDGQYSGWDLLDLGEAETRLLLDEIAADPDSVNLLESWLDTNRAGWREYIAGETDAGPQPGPAPGSSRDPITEAYAVLGLKPGASDDEIKAAHRELMKGVHPDRGGSEFLAAKINEARDRLLGR